MLSTHKARAGFGWIPTLAIAVPSVIAAVLAAWSITVPSLWRDESVSVHFARQPLGDAWRQWGDVDAVHATYDLILRLFTWIEPVELAARLPSLLGFVAATAGVVLIGKRVSGWSTGAYAGCVYALLPIGSRYAQEGRSYALVSAVAVFATLALLRVCERPTLRRAVIYGSLVVLLGCLHLYALLLLLAHALHLLIADRSAIRAVVSAWIGAGLVLSPLAVIASSQRDRQLFWLKPPDLGQLRDFAREIAGSGSAALFLGVLVLLGMWFLRHHPFVALWAVVPMIFSFSISQFYPVFSGRYVLYIVPAVAVLAGAGIDGLARLVRPPRRSALVAVVGIGLVGLLGLSMQQAIRGADSRPDDLRAMSRDLSADLRPGDGLMSVSKSYLMFVNVYSEPFEHLKQVSVDRLPGNQSRIWVISAGFPSKARQPDIAVLDRDFRRKSTHGYGYTHLSLWERR